MFVFTLTHALVAVSFFSCKKGFFLLNKSNEIIVRCTSFIRSRATFVRQSLPINRFGPINRATPEKRDYYTLINPINSPVDSSPSWNFCIFDPPGRRTPTSLLHKSFVRRPFLRIPSMRSRLSCSFLPSLSLSLSAFASCCARQPLHASLANRETVLSLCSSTNQGPAKDFESPIVFQDSVSLSLSLSLSVFSLSLATARENLWSRRDAGLTNNSRIKADLR